MNCPSCDKEMESSPSEPDVNICGGWYCHSCDVFIPEFDLDDDQWELSDAQ